MPDNLNVHSLPCSLSPARRIFSLTNQYAITEYQFLPEDGAGEEVAEEVGVEPPADSLRARQDGVGRVLTLVAPPGELAQAAAQKGRQLLP